MKVPMHWLKQYTDIPVSPADYQDAMVMHGTGVEGLDDLSETFSNVVVGRVLSVRDHENSDHLHVCQVDVGDEQLQIVCGAPNVAEGQLVPVAKIGACLPGGVKIKRGKLRGVESQGMICSGPEIGVPMELYPSVGDKGILVFQEDYPLGADVRAIVGLDDTVVDFEILANRPDCQCVWGVARESAATLGKAFRKPEIKVDTVPGRMEDFVHIDVRDVDLCPRYVARVVKNVKVGPSPMWMRKALHGAGMRSINNIVDITNYVMLETGQPMHAFNLDKVRDRHIIVRRAFEGETIVTLDGKERALTPDMLMIADQTCATGIAGVMGGEESEIENDTVTIMFESAAFDRTSIRLTSRALGLRTEASGRFEKGVHPALSREAVDRACQLVNLLDAGDVIEDVYDNYPNPIAPARLDVSVKRINNRNGVNVSAETMVDILKGLFFTASLDDDGDTLHIVAPEFRQDIEMEADIAEEVLRIYGYEHLGSTLLRGETTPGGRGRAMSMKDKIIRLLTGMGAYEIYNFSFVSPTLVDKLRLDADDPRRNMLKIRNPLGEDTSVMRTTLVPSMLETLARNQNRGNEAATLFEIAPVFDIEGREENTLPRERQSLCVGAYGEDVDFYTVRAMVDELLSQFGVSTQIVPDAQPYQHPGRAAKIVAGEDVICRIGEIHPDVMADFDMARRAVVAEISLEVLAEKATAVGTLKALPRFPAVTRDLALVMDEMVPVGTVMDAIRGCGGAIMESAQLFDVYRGAQMLSGKKSVAFSLSFRSPERTLTDEDVQKVMDKILATCKERFGAVIRA